LGEETPDSEADDGVREVAVVEEVVLPEKCKRKQSLDLGGVEARLRQTVGRGGELPCIDSMASVWEGRERS
jgi:hypothetical protein